MGKINPDHPRAESLKVREKLAEGFKKGLVVPEGLSAHGRGEAFDYILGEKTIKLAYKSIEAATATLLKVNNPVISVNGNTASLVPGKIIELARLVNAKIEVNLFHKSSERAELIRDHLISHGASEVLGTENEFSVDIKEIKSNRKKIDVRGMNIADVILVPLEDGDRTEGLKKIGKTVIAIDLNPMSRTAKAADITIVDNIVRALPKMIEQAEKLSGKTCGCLNNIIDTYDNEENLSGILNFMLKQLKMLSK